MKNKFLNLYRILTLFSSLLLATNSLAAMNQHASLGIGSNWNVNTQDNINHSIMPEVVGYYYQGLNHNFWIGYGARIGYSNGQPDMPQAVQIIQQDIRSGLEAGLFYDWIIVPSIRVGSGIIHRTQSFQVQTPVIVSTDPISGTNILPYLSVQTGIGIPINRGAITLDPYIRYLNVFGDARLGWLAGAEASFVLF